LRFEELFATGQILRREIREIHRRSLRYQRQYACEPKQSAPLMHRLVHQFSAKIRPKSAPANELDDL
jgi:hypothetical protein